MSYKVLLVDDELANSRLLERSLRQTYFCLLAASCSEALRLLAQHDVAVIIASQQMSGISGIELLKRTAEYEADAVRILLSEDADPEVLVEAINSGAVDLYLRRPWNSEDLQLRIGQAVQRYFNNKRQQSLVVANECLLGRLRQMKLGSVRAMAKLLKAKDENLFAHGSRVSRLAAMVGRSFGLTEDLLADLEAAALLHDLGAIETDTLVEYMSGTDRDLAAMERQSERAAQILSCVPELRDVADIIRYQHESYDGCGGPGGLIGEQIPLTSRILSVVNEYDGLTNPCDPAEALEHRAAIERLQDGAYREFDPQVVQVFSDLELAERSSLQDLNATPGRVELATLAIN